MVNKFQEIEFLISRADEHLEWLRQRVVNPDPDLASNNLGYYFLPESGDIFTTNIRIVIGEFASCLRNSLNYFTCAVAEQDSGSVGKRVQFPIESCPKSFTGHRDSYLKGISDEHVAAFERLQPYNAADEGWLGLLRDLSNWYRHHGLIRIQKVIQRSAGPALPTQTERHGKFTVEMDPNFTFAVSLEDGRPIIETLEKILLLVRQTIDELKPALARYLSEHIEDFT